MKTFNSRLNNKLHKYSNNNFIAMDTDDLVTMVKNIESENFNDIWIDDIYSTISKTHSVRKKKEKKDNKKKNKTPSSSSSSEVSTCNTRNEIDMILNDHLKLVKASGAPNYASLNVGSSIAYKNRLTSPSYPEVKQNT